MQCPVSELQELAGTVLGCNSEEEIIYLEEHPGTEPAVDDQPAHYLPRHLCGDPERDANDGGAVSALAVEFEVPAFCCELNIGLTDWLAGCLLTKFFSVTKATKHAQNIF